ncbi:MAG: 4Fe-4S binding protein [Marinilabiliaceae bacterium]|nr:4Fe-4S binding protein [Marinilabiliaceae bacterium]
MLNESFYHALNVNTDQCTGCTHCMMKCPTSAIRIRDGKATIRQDWCVDCGECMRACPVDAIYVAQDDFARIFDFKVRVALLPAVFFGQFADTVSDERIHAAVQEIGFTHVCQVEQTADVITRRMVQAQGEMPDKPLISPFCPAIVRLIQVRFPALVDHIIPIKPPIDATSILYKQMLIGQGIDESDIGLFYVTPCAAKIAAVKSPVGEKQSVINGVINMDFLYNKVQQLLIQQPDVGQGMALEIPPIPHKGALWSLTNGEADRMQGRCLAIDEIHNVIELLDQLETTDQITDVDFLELRGCDEGCAGGVLMSRNRFLIVERLRKKTLSMKDGSLTDNPAYGAALDYLDAHLTLDEILPRSIQAFGADVGQALKKMQQARNLMCYLPGIDCGACGAPNCQSLAEDITRREANLSHCIFLQRTMEKHRKLSSDHAIRIIEKTWGKDRLDKDCRKKGAKYEGK